MIRKIAVAGGAAVLLAACSSAEPQNVSPSVTTIAAEIEVELHRPLIVSGSTGDQCAGALDYSEIRTGSAVTFRDAGDQIIGTEKLGLPEVFGGLKCIWTVATDLKSATDFVTAEVGGWESEPQAVESDAVSFAINTSKEGAGGIGSLPEIDPNWSR
jgi:hypothetical protein